MFNNILEQTYQQQEKENYIADMLVRTLYSNNNINKDECYHIIKIFEEKVLGDVVI